MHDLLIQIIFYVFAALAVGSAMMVISQNNPVRCVLFLVLTFISSSVLWILVEAEFLALILVLVYVGAVMTLFLFVVMMLDIDTESLHSNMLRYLPIGFIVVALLVSLLLVSIPSGSFVSNSKTTTVVLNDGSQLLGTPVEDKAVIGVNRVSNTEALGMILYTDYFLAFELAAVLLLSAIVAAITLAHRGALRSKRQDVTKQIMTQSSSRVKLVNLKAEK